MINKAFKLVTLKFGDSPRWFSPEPKLPYWSHLVIVFEKLIEMGVTNENILVAGILHDLVEDTDVTLKYIENEFNKDIRDMVDLCSKKKNFDGKNKADLDEFYFKILKQSERYSDFCRKGAMYIKVADRVTNLIGISFTDMNEKKDEFIKETHEYFMQMAVEIDYVAALKNAIGYLAKYRAGLGTFK